MELTHTTKDSTCFSSTLISGHFEDSNMCTSFKQNKIILNEHICNSIWESAKLNMLFLKSYDFLKWPNILFIIWGLYSWSGTIECCMGRYGTRGECMGNTQSMWNIMENTIGNNGNTCSMGTTMGNQRGI